MTSSTTTSPGSAAPDLSGFRVAVDVQHVHRPAPRHRDRGSIYTTGVLTFAESDAARIYADAAVTWLSDHGAAVLTNRPAAGVLVGDYWTRNREANRFGAHAYLACHVNSGRGAYAAVEYMRGTAGSSLASHVANELARSVPAVLAGKVVALERGMRGAVCIQAVTAAAVLVEPFFGDNPRHQHLFTYPDLAAIGHVIGRAVAQWWLSR